MALSALQELQNWFPSGTAEGERSILDRVFVYVAELERVVAPKPGNPLLLVGRKGTGKSAIIDFAARILEKQGVPALTLGPVDLPTGQLDDAASIGDIERSFRGVILTAMAAKLVEEKSGLLSGHDATLYAAAVDAGARTPDLISRLAKALPGIAKPAMPIDLSSSFPSLTQTTAEQIQRAVAARVEARRLHLFIDDTDQVASPEKLGHLNRIWGLLLAIRRLASEMPQLCAVVSLREEVWDRLRFHSSGQRDQTDHFASLIVRVQAGNDLVTRIVETRLAAAAARCSDQSKVGSSIYEPFFEGLSARAPRSSDFRSWRDLIVLRSRGRPRDAIQLVDALAEYAQRIRKVTKIDEPTFQSVMPSFSEGRATLFNQEVESEFPQALDVLRSFADVDYDAGSYTLTAIAARDHFISMGSRFSCYLYGRPMRPGIESDAIEIWSFFYLSNILNARTSDQRMKDGYSHIDPAADPTLVNKARWNEMQNFLWEVNPAFRDFLDARRAESLARGGLAKKRPSSRRKRTG